MDYIEKIAEDLVDKATSAPLSKNKCKIISIHGNRKTNAIDWENHLYIYGTDI
jgi:glycerol-3-phosphate dehydrogenase